MVRPKIARPKALSGLVGAGPTYCIMNLIPSRKRTESWKSKCGGFEASELRRVKYIEDEITKLKRMHTNFVI